VTGAAKGASTLASDVGGTSVLAELLRNASIEIAAGRAHALEALQGGFAPGTEVFVNFLPGGDYRPLIATATALRKAGFEPVPHVAARNLENLAALDDFVKRAVGEAGVARMLLIAGDRPAAKGPFASSADMILTGIFERSGIRAVGIAGHPEGHPSVPARELAAALVAKQGLARAAGLNLFIATQFAFDGRPILGWLAETRRAGIAAPVRIGVAGPAHLATLVRFALTCGIGNSLRMLRDRPGTVGRLLGDVGPDELVREVADGLAAMPGHRVAGFHFFPFGGVDKTAAWRKKTLAAM
jgi:methylenetetrahydrofolate reductase (NADPH)